MRPRNGTTIPTAKDGYPKIAIAATAIGVCLGWWVGKDYGGEMGRRAAYQEFVANYRCEGK